MQLDFNPAFVVPDEQQPACWEQQDAAACGALTVSSFANFTPFSADRVMRVFPETLDPATGSVDTVRITDTVPMGPPRTVWPNEAVRVRPEQWCAQAGCSHAIPDVVVNPQGFHVAPAPGRLTMVDLEAPGYPEYVVHQSTSEVPAFYHRVLLMDMDEDGLNDLVTVRSNHRGTGTTVSAQLVWFKNPGVAPSAATWEETVLYGGVGEANDDPSTLNPDNGPDIHLAAGDIDGDGDQEIVATHFFNGAPNPPFIPPGSPVINGEIALYGAPDGMKWSEVDPSTVKRATISADQGWPFDIQIVDLNADGKLDILATNHQPAGCSMPWSLLPAGKVYALVAPESGDVFDGSTWETKILLDDIRPNNNPTAPRGPGRLAPGAAHAFYKSVEDEQAGGKPYIVVGGDEASKVWLLSPRDEDFSYRSDVIFDINSYYGEGTTQEEILYPTPFGSYPVSISTIGLVGTRYDDQGKVEIYIPVFEAKDIHVFGLGGNDEPIDCQGEGITYVCE